MNPHHLDAFMALWSEYDDGSGTIEPRHLEDLLLRLEPPMGLGPGQDGKAVLRFVFNLDIPLVAGRVPFHRTVYELVRRCVGCRSRRRSSSIHHAACSTCSHANDCEAFALSYLGQQLELS